MKTIGLKQIKKAKSRKKLGKKGIAPLVATVLLIAFAVALASIVINWGTAYTRETQEVSEKESSDQYLCSIKVDFDILKVIRDEEEEFINITVENKKEKEIKGFAVKVLDKEGGGESFETGELNLTALKIDEFEFNLTEDFINITTIKLIPRVESWKTGEEFYCQDNHRQLTNQSEKFILIEND